MAYHTFTGIEASRIPATLARIFDDPRAYKGVPGGADLTDINTGHMIERITDTFGPKGLGWNFLFQPEHMEIVNPLEKRVVARLRYAIFKYALIGEDDQLIWLEIPTSGANANELAYAEEGARTSALGAAIKGLCFQLPIYKGLLDHHNAAAEISKTKANGSAPAAPAAGVGEKTAAPTPEKKGEARVLKELGFPPPEGPSQVSACAEDPGLEAGISAGNYVIPIGSKHKGKRLAELSEQALGWYANELQPTSDAGREVQSQAKAYLAERTAVPA